MMKRFASNILLLFSSLLITFLFVEAVLRIIGYDPLRSFRNARFQFVRPSSSKERVYEAVPSTEVFLWNTFVKINSHGFRGREYAVKKSPGTFRVISLGDSIGFGQFLPIQQTFTEQLESMFQKEKKKVEVLNLGFPGYDTLQEVATLEDIGLQFKPDLVVVCYCINDVMTMSLDLLYVKSLKRYRSFLYRSRVLQFIRSNLDKLQARRYVHEENKESVFLAKNKDYIVDVSKDVVLNKLIRKLRRDLDEAGRISFVVPPYLSQARIGKLRYSFERLKALQDKNGFDVIVMLVPFLKEEETSKEAYHTVYNIVEHEATRLGFTVLNMYPEFQKAGFEHLAIAKDDALHPNAFGNRLMAQKLFGEINTRYLPKFRTGTSPREKTSEFGD